MIHRLDLAYADRAEAAGNNPPDSFAPNQLTWMAVGVLLFVAVLYFVRDHRMLQRYTYTAALAGLGLLVLPLVPGISAGVVNGSRIWIRVLGFSFQPGEVAKILIIVAMAGYLVVTRDALALAGRRVLGLDLPRARDLGPILIAWAASLGVLIFERDLGTSLLFFGIFVVLLYVATERVSWLFVGAGLFLSGALVAWRLFSHVQSRVESGCARSTTPTRRSRSSSPCTAWPTAASSAPASARAAPTSYPSPTPTSSSPRSVRSSGSPG